MSVAAAVGMKALQIAGQNRSTADMLSAQAAGSYKQMNYAFQNYEIERQDAYDAAVNEIMKVRINQQQLNSGVNAAIMEGYAGGGRTAARLMRAADADTARSVSSIQDNYMRKSSEIDLNKEQTLLSTKDYLVNLKNQYKPNKFADILSLAATGFSAYNGYLNDKAAKDVATASGTGSTGGALSSGKSMIASWPQQLANGFRMFAGDTYSTGTDYSSGMLVDPLSNFSNYYDASGNLVDGSMFNSGNLTEMKNSLKIGGFR